MIFGKVFCLNWGGVAFIFVVFLGGSGSYFEREREKKIERTLIG